MTKREWVEKNMPEKTGVRYIGGVAGCPGEEKFADMPGSNKPVNVYCGGECTRTISDYECAKCWDEEIYEEPVAEPKKDMINPDHYKVHKHECFQEIKALLTPEEYRGWLKGSFLKYRYRTGHKDDPAQESSKSDWFMDKLMEELGMLTQNE